MQAHKLHVSFSVFSTLKKKKISQHIFTILSNNISFSSCFFVSVGDLLKILRLPYLHLLLFLSLCLSLIMWLAPPPPHPQSLVTKLPCQDGYRISHFPYDMTSSVVALRWRSIFMCYECPGDAFEGEDPIHS